MLVAKGKSIFYPLIGHQYVACVRQLLPNLQSGGSSRDNPHVVPFTLTCAAALEASLNDAYIWLTHEKFGFKTYRRYAEHFLKLSPKAKLDLYVPTVTGYSHSLNTDHKVYHQLNELVSLRNKLVHDRQFLQELDFKITWPDGTTNFEVSDNVELVDQPDTSDWAFASVTAEKARRFFEALEIFDSKVLFRTDTLAETAGDLVLPLAADKGAKPV